MESQKEFWNIDPISGTLLEALIHAKKPQQILEVGTSNGYSAIRMGHVVKQYGGHITTIEFFGQRVELARKNIQDEWLSETIEVLQGDAIEIMSAFSSLSFDFIFLDANKEEYVLYFKYAMQLVQPNGIIIADNTISHDKKLTEFFAAVKQEPRAHALELSIGAGLLLIRVE